VTIIEEAAAVQENTGFVSQIWMQLSTMSSNPLVSELHIRDQHPTWGTDSAAQGRQKRNEPDDRT